MQSLHRAAKGAGSTTHEASSVRTPDETDGYDHYLEAAGADQQHWARQGSTAERCTQDYLIGKAGRKRKHLRRTAGLELSQTGQPLKRTLAV